MREIQALILKGHISAGEKIVWNRRVKKISHKAHINHDGSITTEDGLVHRTPSGAAKHLNQGKPVDGWLAWSLESTNEPLAHFRNKIGS
jgi:hypothetical protein